MIKFFLLLFGLSLSGFYAFAQDSRHSEDFHPCFFQESRLSLGGGAIYSTGLVTGMGLHRNFRKMTVFAEYDHSFALNGDDKFVLGLFYMIRL